MCEFSSPFSKDIKDLLGYKSAAGFGTDSLQYPLRRFDQFVVSHFPNTPILTKEIVDAFINDETSCGRSGIRNKLCAIRTLGRYMNSIGKNSYILPITMIPRAKRYNPYIMSDDELRILFKQMDEMRSGHWDPMMLKGAPVMYRLIYTCGLRPGEGFWLKKRNVNFDTGEVLIEKTKKNKDRVVVMSNDMRKLLCRYRTLLESEFPQSEYLFVNKHGKRCVISSLQKFLTWAWRRANHHIGICNPPRIRPYDLRHRFASVVLCKWAAEGKDIFAKLPFLRAYMGHAHISSTMYYVHLLPKTLIGAKAIDWQSLNSIYPED